MRRALLPLIGCAALAACGFDDLAADPERVPPPDSAEYAVMSAVVERVIGRRDRMVVIEDSTQLIGGPWTEWEARDESLADTLAVPRETVRAFKARNTARHPLRPAFGLSAPYRMISESELRAAFGVPAGAGWKQADLYDGWERLADRFPNFAGVVGVSRAAFTPDGNTAIVYYSHGCGDLCGGGEYLVLRRTDGRWRVIRSLDVWAS
ncbi:MAG: hypothetical protein KY444_09560 [Gemmatimonadetes bacterium]|nr:hypothetical protein [Gemmatimonadota bacterium]